MCFIIDEINDFISMLFISFFSPRVMIVLLLNLILAFVTSMRKKKSSCYDQLMDIYLVKKCSSCMILVSER